MNSHDRERVIAWGQELRVVHGRLRDALQFAREAVEDGRDTESLAKNLELFCWGFCSALTRHHGSEDSSLFPLVLSEAPELASAIGKLVQDHNMIAYLIAELEKALTARSKRDILLRHLDGIEAVMETHFRFEEKQLVGLLNLMAGPIDELDRTTLFGPIA